MKKSGVKTLGFIGFNDPYGENWLKVFSAPMADKDGIRIVAIERYARTDASVTGQALKLIAAKPDAMFIAAVGGPAVLPQATLRDQGWKGPIYQTHAVATQRLHHARQGQGRGHGARCRPDAGARRRCRTRIRPRRSRRLHRRRTRSSSARGRRRSARTCGTAGSCSSARFPSRSSREAGHRGVSQRAARRARELARGGRHAGRVQHVTPTNHNGMDERARVPVVVRDGRFRLLPE